MEHEHQNPFAGIKWHEKEVYKALAKPPNKWKRSETFHNILEKLSTNQVQGSTWDPDSIMEYEFEPGLIDEPEKYDINGLTPPGTLSKADKEWVRNRTRQWQQRAGSHPFQSVAAELTAGEQMDYEIRPTESHKYCIETKGATDTLLVLFEDVGGVPRLLSGDDDSGEERNAWINYKLFNGRKYIARLRVNYPGRSGKASLMIS